jgi:hypothetical protein
LGVVGDSLFVYRHWRGDGKIIIDNRKDEYSDYPKHRNVPPQKTILGSAFTVAELGEMLPMAYDTMRNSIDGWMGYDVSGKYCPIDCKGYTTEAECRGDMLIYLIENKLIEL